MQTDSLFYRLFQNWPQQAFKLLQLSYPAEDYQFVSEEIKQTGFRIDGIFKPIAGNPDQPYIFTEVQYQADPDFYGRFFSEIMLYLYRYKPGRHWLALVIYPARSVEKPPAKEFELFYNSPQLVRIYLEDYQQRTEPDYALLRLIACPESDTIRLARELAGQQGAQSQDVIEFLETVLVYKLPTLSREEIRTMLGLNDVQLKQTRFYQEIAEEERREGKQEGMQEGKQEGKQEGIREGIQKGRQEGRLEGRLEGEIQFLTKLLNKRFGPLPEPLLEKLHQADIALLELWGERTLDAKTLEEVFA